MAWHSSRNKLANFEAVGKEAVGKEMTVRTYLQEVRQFATSISGSPNGIQTLYRGGNDQAAGALPKAADLPENTPESSHIISGDVAEASDKAHLTGKANNPYIFCI